MSVAGRRAARQLPRRLRPRPRPARGAHDPPEARPCRQAHELLRAAARHDCSPRRRRPRSHEGAVRADPRRATATTTAKKDTQRPSAPEAAELVLADEELARPRLGRRRPTTAASSAIASTAAARGSARRRRWRTRSTASPAVRATPSPSPRSTRPATSPTRRSRRRRRRRWPATRRCRARDADADADARARRHRGAVGAAGHGVGDRDADRDRRPLGCVLGQRGCHRLPALPERVLVGTTTRPRTPSAAWRAARATRSA